MRLAATDFVWIGNSVNGASETSEPTRSASGPAIAAADRRVQVVTPMVGSPRLIVPRENESVLIAPSMSDLPGVALSNHRRMQQATGLIHGLSLPELRNATRAEITAVAVEFTSSLIGDTAAAGSPGPLVVTGHQPELFHVGVWAKNFVSSSLAQQTQGLAINLIVDNDTVTTTRIRVPVGTTANPGIDWIPFDTSRPLQPWEDAFIADRDCFRKFADRVGSQIRACWNYVPLLESAWPAAIRHSENSSRLCDCLAAARVAVERAHGLRNLEVPMSRVCQTRSFHRFVVMILSDLGRFQTIYNESVRRYRRANHLHSSTHPVPELEARDGWIEAPFWIWNSGDLRRQRPFVRQAGAELELRVGQGVLTRIPLSSLDSACDALAELSPRGVRLRSRALTTTLFARLFLADLFIHGIGGAKYDAMTDEICELFFGVTAPHFATVTATAHLPLGSPFSVTAGDLRRLNHRIRDLHYNPDRYLADTRDSVASPNQFCSCSRSFVDSDVVNAGLAAEKRQIVESIQGRHPTNAEHRRMSEINVELRPPLERLRAKLEADRGQMQARLQANSILQSRDFSWCLQPETVVTSFFRRELLG